MSALTERIAAEHRQHDATGAFDIYGYCSCGGWDASDTDETRTFVTHIAEVTEAAVREELAWDTAHAVLPTHPNAGYRAGLIRASHMIRGEQ